MNVEEVLREFQTTRNGSPCWYRGTPPKAKALVDALLADKRVQATTISKLLKAKFAYSAGQNAVRRHRRGDCTCR